MASLHESSCPRCGRREVHPRAAALAPKLTGVNFICWLFGGMILSIGWSLAKPKRCMCKACGHLFTTLTRASQLWLLVFLALVALVLWGFWLEWHSGE